jgi:hypothetical protein
MKYTREFDVLIGGGRYGVPLAPVGSMQLGAFGVLAWALPAMEPSGLTRVTV